MIEEKKRDSEKVVRRETEAVRDKTLICNASFYYLLVFNKFCH